MSLYAPPLHSIDPKLMAPRKLPTIKMPSLSSSYLLPAILLNPAFVLHLINTYVSHMWPPPLTVSHSPHQTMQSLGPLPGSTLYLDMHADEQLCWRYTIGMVVVQLLAFLRVSDNRQRRKSAREAAKLERERLRKEKAELLADKRIHVGTKVSEMGNYLDGAREFPVEPYMNGTTHKETNGILANHTAEAEKMESESESSLTETSEEEMIV